MNGRKLVTAAAIATTLVAGCGYQHMPRSGASRGHRPGIAPAGCVVRKLPPSRVLSLTEKDTGTAYCVARGARILVFLHGSPASMWSPPRASSAILRPAPSGIFTLMRGVTGGSFVAEQLGTATITSARCGSNLRKAEPNASACPPGVRFIVHVTVLGTL